MQKDHPASYLQGQTSFPIVLGHENVAMIDRVGSEVEGWEVGQRVCVEPSLSCTSRGFQQQCPPCAAGHFSLCENSTNGQLPKGTMVGLNAFTGGSWAPYFVAHQSQLHEVPKDLPNEQAILTDPVSCALHGVLRHIPRDDDKVLVMGAGIIGLGTVASIRALGSKANIAAIARHVHQIEWLRRLGANDVIRFSDKDKTRDRYDLIARKLGGQRIDGRFGNYGLLGGYDVVFNCLGSGSSLTDGFKFTRPGGTTVLLGTSNITLVDTTPMWNKELQVLGSYGRQIEKYGGKEMHTYELLYELVAKGKLNLDGLLTHTFKTNQYKEAFQTLTSRQRQAVIKAAFVFE